MFVITGAGTYVFWLYIEAFEKSRHEHVIQSLEENIDYDFWVNKAEYALIPLLTQFETNSAAALAPHLSGIRDVRYTLRQKTDENTSDMPVYIIRAGPRDIGIVRLTPTADIGFGFHMWDVKSIEFLDSFFDGMASSIYITVSRNANVEINGIPVTEEYRIESEINHAAVYQIDGIFGNAEVTVTEIDGRISIPIFAENGEFFFPISIPFSQTFEVLIQEGTNIFINGERVSDEFITAGNIIPDIFIGEEILPDVPFKLLRYKIELDGLYEEPVLTANDEYGNPLIPEISEDGLISFMKPFNKELEFLHASTVEDFVISYIRFGANIGNNASANFADLSKKILSGTDLYERVRSAIDTMRWTRNVVVEYNFLDISSFRHYGDNLFTCEVQYNITTRTSYEENIVEGNFEILFILSGERWLAVKMLAIQ